MRDGQSPPRTAVRPWLGTLGHGALIGALIGLAPVTAWFVRIQTRADFVGLARSSTVLRYAMTEAASVLAIHAAIGSAVAVWIALAGPPRPSPVRATVGVLTGWAVLFAGSVIAAPAAWRAVPLLRTLPVWAFVLILAGIAASGARVAALRPGRFVAGAALFVAALLWPTPRLHAAADRAATRPNVMLIGIDAFGRDGFDTVVALLERRHPEVLRGATYFRHGISQAPLTRLSWLGVLSGRDPTLAGETQFVGSEAQAETESKLSPSLPDTLRTLGYRTAFLSDWSETSHFSTHWFTDERLDARGWQATIRTSLHSVLPVQDLLLGRWSGVGLATRYGVGTPRRLWKTALTMLAESDGPMLVATHTVVLHTPINLAPSEYPSMAALATMRPAAFMSVRTPAQDQRRRQAAGAGSPSWQDLYRWRAERTAHETAALLVEMVRAGYRENAVVVLFADHGESFTATGQAGGTTAGVHGFSLDPLSVGVAVLVLPPAGPDAGPLVIDTSRTLSLYDIRALVQAVLGDGTLPPGICRPERLLALHAGAALAGASDAFAQADRRFVPIPVFARSLRFLPDGGYAADPAALVAMDSANSRGWYAAGSSIDRTPLQSGQFRVRTFEGTRLTSDTVVDAHEADQRLAAFADAARRADLATPPSPCRLRQAGGQPAPRAVSSSTNQRSLSRDRR